MSITESLFPFYAAYKINKEKFQEYEFYKTKELNRKWHNLLKNKFDLYDAVIEKIEKSITAKNFGDINSQWMNGLHDELSEEKIKEIHKIICTYTEEGILSKWKGLICDQGSPPDKKIIEKITNDMYTAHERWISNIERKSASLLVAVGFSITLISIIMGFADNPSKPDTFELLALFFFSLSMLNMVFAAISAWFAERVQKRNLSTVGDLEKTLKSPDFESNWAIMQLTNLELNNVLGHIKANWLDVGQRHFIRGLIFTVIGFFIMAIEMILKVTQ